MCPCFADKPCSWTMSLDFNLFKTPLWTMYHSQVYWCQKRPFHCHGFWWSLRSSESSRYNREEKRGDVCHAFTVECLSRWRSRQLHADNTKSVVIFSTMSQSLVFSHKAVHRVLLHCRLSHLISRQGLTMDQSQEQETASRQLRKQMMT